MATLWMSRDPRPVSYTHLGVYKRQALDRAHGVGHDWGGGLAWAVATAHPERVARLTVLSTPHPAAMGWAMRHGTPGVKSWYMAAFQLPVLPEALLGPALRRFGMRGLGLAPEHERAYVATLTEPGALTGAINWYRALATSAPDGVEPLPRRRISVPTTYVWGRRDAYLGRAAAEKTEAVSYTHLDVYKRQAGGRGSTAARRTG